MERRPRVLGPGRFETHTSIQRSRPARGDSDNVYKCLGIDLGPGSGQRVPIAKDQEGQVNFQSQRQHHSSSHVCVRWMMVGPTPSRPKAKAGPNRPPASTILPNSIQFGLNVVGSGPQHCHPAAGAPLGPASRSKAPAACVWREAPRLKYLVRGRDRCLLLLEPAWAIEMDAPVAPNTHPRVFLWPTSGP